MKALKVSQHLSKFDAHGSSASGIIIMYLICHVTSQDHLNLEAMQTYRWKLLTVYQLWISLVIIDVVIEEICFQFVR